MLVPEAMQQIKPPERSETWRKVLLNPRQQVKKKPERPGSLKKL